MAVKKTTPETETVKAAETKAAEVETKKDAAAAEAVVEKAEAAEEKAEKKPAARKRKTAEKKTTTTKKTAAKKKAAAEAVTEEKAEDAAAPKKTRKTAAPKKTTTRKKAVKKDAPVEEAPAEAAPVEAAAPAEAPAAEAPVEAAPVEAPVVEEVVEEAPAPELPQPRRSIAFIGSECYPFVKTGGLGDVMYALPKALISQNCDVRVILPRYKCIPDKYQEKMVYRGAFDMDLCADGKRYYVGIMEYVWDGVVYDFIDNEEFFSVGKPYTNLIDDIPKFCYFGKAALAALNYMDWIPDVIHCHDWQAGLVPIYLRTMFTDTPISRSKVMITIHNLRFQGIYDIPTIKYWSGLPDYVFNKDALKQGYDLDGQ